MKTKKFTLHEPVRPRPSRPVTPPAGWRNRETYDGAELKPFTGRPGAMDAFKLPSRGIA